jgi:hypothetical protein
MNSNTSTTSSISSPTQVSADAISRRAYELWEADGRPDGSDLQHWLQAERELSGNSANTNGNGSHSNSTVSVSAASTPTDTRPLQGTRGAAPATREPKRNNPPVSFGTDKTASANAAPAMAKRR